MRIITVNLPQPQIKAIDSMCGEHGVFPSRSELVRVAVREFLIREMQTMRPKSLSPDPPIPESLQECKRVTPIFIPRDPTAPPPRVMTQKIILGKDQPRILHCVDISNILKHLPDDC